MQIKKRDGSLEPVNFNKISKRIQKLTRGIKKHIDILKVSQNVIAGIYDGVTTKELDLLAAETAHGLGVDHPDYLLLAGRIEVSILQKEAPKIFSEACERLGHILKPEFSAFVKKHARDLDLMIEEDRDYTFEFMGIRTLKKSYLLKDLDGNLIETPQYLYMRVAVALWMNSENPLEKIKYYYDLISKGFVSHATPTMFNAGTQREQLSSCFLSEVQDSLESIFDHLKECAHISKYAGGLGIAFHRLRASGSPISTTGGRSNGLIPFLRIFNEMARSVDQCFVEGTVVYSDRGPKKIEEVQVGDSLISSDGKYNCVGEVRRFSKEKEPLLKINVKKSTEPIQVTEMHPFYVIRGHKKGSAFSLLEKKLSSGRMNPEWVEAKDLNTDDLVGFPIPKVGKDLPHISKEDCYLYGLLLGDGYMCKKEPVRKKERHQGFKISCTKGDEKVLGFLRSYCRDRLIEYVEEPSDSGKVDFRTCYSHRVPFNKSSIYDSEGCKFFLPQMSLLPEEKSMMILKGLMDSDGHQGNELLLEMTSQQVIQTTRFMLLRHGILTSGYYRDRVGTQSSYRKITTRKPTWVLRVPKVEKICSVLNVESGCWQNQFIYDNFVYSRISSIEETAPYTGLLYDFKMEREPHNYMTHGGLVHNGGGKRKGSAAIYLEPWHLDIKDFLDLRKNQGAEERRCRDLFTALWIPDLFMKRVKDDSHWTLFDPSMTPDLPDLYDETEEGGSFTDRYLHYEENISDNHKVVMKARHLFSLITQAQMETGTPYILFKDQANRASSQKKEGVIHSSNLCCEILENTSTSEISVCNLASIVLNRFVKGRSFDYEKLRTTVHDVVGALNEVIDINFYPVEKTRKTNFRYRPIGIGVQALADAMALLKIQWDSEKAEEFNKKVMATMYMAAVEKSIEIAKEKGACDIDLVKDVLHFDHYSYSDEEVQKLVPDSVDVKKIREDLKNHGMRNSLLIALMPTATSAHILGSNECFEPFTNHLYKRKILAGEFLFINKHLIRELCDLDLWSEEMAESIIYNNGSIQGMEEIPQEVRNRHKTVWEIGPKSLINLSAARAPFVDQSQSFNLWIAEPTTALITRALFYGWEKKIKTGMYYLRRKTKATANKNLGVRKKVEVKKPVEVVEEEPVVCSIDNPDCGACGA